MATTHRSEDEGTCKWCHGKLSIIVSRDPDEEVDCVCTDQPEETDAERVDAFAKSVGIELMPWQRDVAVRALRGQSMVRIGGHRAGMATIDRIAEGVSKWLSATASVGVW